MRLSKRIGYVVYPLFFLAFFTTPNLRAQSSPDVSPAAQSPTEQQQENPQEDQLRLAREAQARIRARRQQRVNQQIQDIYSHKFEAYGGGGYTRFHPGPHLQHINEMAWHAGFTDFIRPRLGITVDGRGYYGDAYIGNSTPYEIFKPNISQYAFLAGPQYRITRGLHFATSAQILLGVAKGNFKGNPEGFPGTLLGMWSDSTVFTADAGIPLDYNFSPAIAFRLTPNYLLTTFDSTLQKKNIGFTASIVYRFGRRK